MNAPTLTLVALALSAAISALALALGMTTDRVSGDPKLRDRLWAVLLLSPLLPLLLVGLTMLLPPPVQIIEVQIASEAVAPVTTGPGTAARAGGTIPLDMDLIAWVAVGMAALGTAIRTVGLIIRAVRLRRLLAKAYQPSQALERLVILNARNLGVPAPAILISDAVADPLLVGPRARLVLPAAFESSQAEPETAAVVAHELAHLKRGDHRALWLEEGLMVVVAFNPLMSLLRRRRDAAREEACDALALAGAAPEIRRAYAHRLIEALRNRAGPQPLALTFTGAGRTIAMKRLNAILSPAEPAGRRTRLAVTAAGLGLAAAVGAGSWAVAAQRPAEVRAMPMRTQEVSAHDRAVAEARYLGLSAEGYRSVCQSGDQMDEGYCAGVMFSQLHSTNSGVCGPTDNDREALAAYVAAGKAAMQRIAPRTDEGAVEYAGRVMAETFPCPAGDEIAFNAGAIDLDVSAPAGLAPPPTGGGRLWVRFDSADMQTYQGDRLILTLSGQADDGVRYEHVSEVSTGPDGQLPDMMFVDLAASYFPGAGERRAYELSARIRRGDQVVYVSDATTVRLAPGSQGSLNRLRPVLELRPA